MLSKAADRSRRMWEAVSPVSMISWVSSVKAIRDGFSALVESEAGLGGVEKGFAVEVGS